MKVLNSLVLASALVGFGVSALADGNDSSSDAQQLVSQIGQSQGVIVRVPLNATGMEDTANAQLRVQLGDAPLSGAQDSVTAWDSALDASSMPVVGGDVNSDSSTNGRHHGRDGWQNYRGHGYSNAYTYYYNYTPTYYYGGGYSYGYNRPSYYDYNYGGYGGCGYRYYYYSRRW